MEPYGDGIDIASGQTLELECYHRGEDSTIPIFQWTTEGFVVGGIVQRIFRLEGTRRGELIWKMGQVGTMKIE